VQRGYWTYYSVVNISGFQILLTRFNVNGLRDFGDVISPKS